MDVGFRNFLKKFFDKIQNAPVCKLQTGAKELSKVYIECVEYGTYSDENDTLVIRGENGELYILLENRIKDIEELHE